MGEAIGEAEVSDIPVTPSGAGGIPEGVAPSLWDLIICISWSEGTPINFSYQFTSYRNLNLLNVKWGELFSFPPPLGLIRSAEITLTDYLRALRPLRDLRAM